jgi:2-polyprenyl-6-methoxyphenol hydroxylase-like FAD-dependent oxidoreductase
VKLVIAGAGVGGLTAALSLHAAGFTDVIVLEATRAIRDVGVGINLPPHAVRELTELGLGEELAAAGVPTAELAYYDARGQLIWAEPRGTGAGYHWPQYSIHRGRLQRILLDAVLRRLGAQAVRPGQRVQATAVRPEGGVAARAIDVETGEATWHEADVLIAADGIRSALRDQWLGAPVPLAGNGWVMYRGTAQAAPFLSGKSMVIVGDEHQRVVVYPIGAGLINWLLVRPGGGASGQGELGNWNVEVAPQMVASFAAPWHFDWLDVPALVGASTVAYEYPMADIEPLPRWVFGRCALLGDAAHAMYPFGSNGASQAILDARVLARELATHRDPAEALLSYESLRLPATAAVQSANRRQAGDVMARVSEMARSNAHDHAAAALQEVEQRYKQLAGFDVDTLNNRPSLSVPKADAATH